MSANNTPSKSANISIQTSPASQAGLVPNPGSDSSRRSGGSGGSGASSISRSNLASARNNQCLRKQNKTSRRPKLPQLATEDVIAESAAMHSSSSRRGQTNITHLMRFALPPRPQYVPSHVHGRGGRRNPTWGIGSGYHAIDKARYINANYRFIVDPRGDYHIQATNPDTHLEWDNVLQILVSAKSQDASCPICLATPVAPRMARCGHIICLSCLVRYMHSTDDATPVPEKKSRWKKCPLCEDTIYLSAVRPVRWYTGAENDAPAEGSDIVLRLIEREARCTLALPRDGANIHEPSGDIPWYFAAEVIDYARVMKGNRDYMIEQFDIEIQEIQRQGHEDELLFGEGEEWTRQAIAMVREAKEKMEDIESAPVDLKQSTNERARKQSLDISGKALETVQTEAPSRAEDLKHPNAVSSLSSERESSEKSRQHATTKPTSSRAGKRPAPPPKPSHSGNNHYYFYQALPHYYLSPLDIRILRAAFGNYSEFPATILPRVERVSTGHIVDDDFRKRVKYLAHLPYGCEVNFLDCDWTDVVSEEVLAGFQTELNRRRKRVLDKEMREERDRARAEREQDRRWVNTRRSEEAGTSRSHFSEDDFQPLVMDSVSANQSVEVLSTSSSPPWPTSRIEAGPSHYAALASPSTSPEGPRTVWGTRAIASQVPDLQVTPHDTEATDDGWLQGWEKDLLSEDSIVAQVAASTAGSHGRKKKGKKITLMSTNVRRGA